MHSLSFFVSTQLIRKINKMIVSPRNSPRVMAAKKVHPTTAVMVCKKSDSRCSSWSRIESNSFSISTMQALGRIHVLVLTILLLVGHITLCCNLYIMLWLHQASTTTTNNNNNNNNNNYTIRSDHGRPAVLVRIATREMEGPGWSKHKSIRNIWGYQSTNEGPSKDVNQSKPLLVQPGKEKAGYQQDLDLTRHVLAKDMLDIHLEKLESIPIDRRANLPNDWPMGVLSDKSVSFFQEIQRRVDEEDPAIRCSRYEGMSYHPTKRRYRRIFFGSLIADEPWELLEIVGTEAYGIFEGVVLVESNRTQSFKPRQFQRLHHGPAIQKVFGTPNLQVRAYVNETRRLHPLTREHLQREEILKGWKAMGMEPDDIGYLGDLDETFTRDFLRAVQTCELDILTYDSHQCERAKIVSTTRTFEGSPECIAEKDWWQ
jgi:hypothetical protein